MSVKVEMYPQGERLDCSISQAGRRVIWTIHLSPRGYIKSSHEFKTVDICFMSLLHKFHNIFFKYVNFKMTFTTKKLTFSAH